MKTKDPYQRPCPYCGEAIDADWVDVGVGMVQCGPYHCYNCNASEIGPERDDVLHELDEDEMRTGFYKGRVSPHANQVAGVPVEYRTDDMIYRAKCFAETGNPLNAPLNRLG